MDLFTLFSELWDSSGNSIRGFSYYFFGLILAGLNRSLQSIRCQTHVMDAVDRGAHGVRRRSDKVGVGRKTGGRLEEWEGGIRIALLEKARFLKESLLFKETFNLILNKWEAVFVLADLKTVQKCKNSSFLGLEKISCNTLPLLVRWETCPAPLWFWNYRLGD